MVDSVGFDVVHPSEEQRSYDNSMPPTPLMHRDTSTLKIGDSYEAMKKKMITFEQAGYHVQPTKTPFFSTVSVPEAENQVLHSPLLVVQRTLGDQLQDCVEDFPPPTLGVGVEKESSSVVITNFVSDEDFADHVDPSPVAPHHQLRQINLPNVVNTEK